MNRNELHDDLIDLGAASAVIQGILPNGDDENGGQPVTGLSNE